MATTGRPDHLLARLLAPFRRLFHRDDPFPERIPQPRAWSDSEGWDAYWRAVIADEFERSDKAGALWRDPFVQQFLPLLRERGTCRLLFAGNGISLEPHVLAHCGFDVTAVEVSPAACAFVREYQLTPPQMGHFLPAYRPKTELGGLQINAYDPAASLDRVRDEHRPGGRLEVLAEDLLRWSPDQHFDVVYAERSVQGFPGEVQRGLAQRFFDWLSPGGIAVVTLVHAPEELEQRLGADFKAAGFFIHLEETAAWQRAKVHRRGVKDAEGRRGLAADERRCTQMKGHARDEFDREYAEREEAEEARERIRLAAGEKQVVLWNSRS
jgi:hypothetical protein